MKKIDTLDQWKILESVMKEKGYRLWQMQYGINCPEGFHARFSRTTPDDKRKDVEVVTFNKDVKEAVLLYNSEK